MPVTEPGSPGRGPPAAAGQPQPGCRGQCSESFGGGRTGSRPGQPCTSSTPDRQGLTSESSLSDMVNFKPVTFKGELHLETHTRSQTPQFMSYPMDMTWILQYQVYFLAKCHIHVISMSYLFFKKDIFGYTWYILN